MNKHSQGAIRIEGFNKATSPNIALDTGQIWFTPILGSKLVAKSVLELYEEVLNLPSILGEKR